MILKLFVKFFVFLNFLDLVMMVNKVTYFAKLLLNAMRATESFSKELYNKFEEKIKKGLQLNPEGRECVSNFFFFIYKSSFY